MTQYFGFIPSKQLDNMIDEAIDIIESKQAVEYYPYRNALTQQIASELIDNLLVNLIDVIPNSERKAAMRKIVTSIEHATETLLSILLGKDNNQDVRPSFYFLKDKSMFIDDQGKRRVGFALSDTNAAIIQNGFDAISPDHTDRAAFKKALSAINDAALTHFVSDFTATLKLGLFKKKAIPVAKATVNKGMDIALNRLLPQLPDAGLNRLANFYRPYLIRIGQTPHNK